MTVSPPPEILYTLSIRQRVLLLKSFLIYVSWYQPYQRFSMTIFHHGGKFSFMNIQMLNICLLFLTIVTHMEGQASLDEAISGDLAQITPQIQSPQGLK